MTMSKRRTARQHDLAAKPRTMSRWGRLRALWRDTSGATAVEFVFVAIPVIYMMVGILEFSAAMTVSNSLEAATNLSSRLGKTGYVDTEADLDQSETIREEIERRVGPLIDMNKLDIDAKAFSDFGDVDNPEAWNDADEDGEPDPGEWTDTDGDNFCDGCTGFGGADNVVIYTITYPWTIMTPLMNRLLGEDGILTLTAYSVVKNEPY
jgi:Flp pilus assembly pilin Flp